MDRTTAARGLLMQALCCLLAWVTLGCTQLAGRSGLLRITDPNEPIHELGPIIEEVCTDEESIVRSDGTITLRFPPGCRHSLGPVPELVDAGFANLSTLVAPLTAQLDSTLIILDSRELPGNVRYTSSAVNTVLVLAPFGCDHEGWWRAESVWSSLVGHFFHETTHASIGRYFPPSTPQWMTEGTASYVAHRIDADLSLRFRSEALPEAPLVARFVAASPDSIRAAFGRKDPFPVRPAAATDARDAYALYVGSFLAAERSGDSVFDQLIQIGQMRGETEKRAALRGIDPQAVHAGAQSLRTELTTMAIQAAAGGGEAATAALVTLGWLGECPTGLAAPQPEACGSAFVDLAPYYGSCLAQDQLEEIIAGYVACGKRLRPEWSAAVDGYCRRFPSTARDYLSDLAGLASSGFVRSLLRCDATAQGRTKDFRD